MVYALFAIRVHQSGPFCDLISVGFDDKIGMKRIIAQL